MKGRTGKSLRNVAVSAGVQICSLLLLFFVRTALVMGLGRYYLGLNSVMTSMIAVFNLAELGLTNAVVYSLYRPLARHDTRKIEAYMSLYKRVYRIIGIAVVVLSVVALPFLPKLVNAEMTPEVYAVYFLFVASSAITYVLFTYRGAILQANQEKYLVAYADLAYSVVSSIGQVVCFLVFENYIAGLAVLVASQIVRSVALLILSRKKHPEIDFGSKEKLDEREKKACAKNVYAMAIGKFSDTASKSVPNMAISAGIGLIESGYYSNYQMIASAITTLLSQAFGSMTASVGNLHVEVDKERKLRVFERLNFAAFFVYAICCTCIFSAAEPFIAAWIGSGYVLDEWCVFGISFNLLTIGLLHGTVVFKDGCGIFFQGRFRPLVSCILAVVLCVILVGPFGVAGAIWAPALSRLLTANWYDPLLLHKYVFKQSPLRYYVRTLIYAIVGCSCMLVARLACSLLPGESWTLFFECVLLSAAVAAIIVLALFCKSESEKYLVGFVKDVFSGRMK